MPLRRRLSIIAAASVGIAILAASVVCYLVVRHQLRGQIDDALTSQAHAIQQGELESLQPNGVAGLPASAGGPAPYAFLVAANGQRATVRGYTALPATNTAKRIATMGGMAQFDVTVNGNHVRVMAFRVPLTNGGYGAMELGRSLNGTDKILSDLRLRLVFLLLRGGVVAGTAR